MNAEPEEPPIHSNKGEIEQMTQPLELKKSSAEELRQEERRPERVAHLRELFDRPKSRERRCLLDV